MGKKEGKKRISADELTSLMNDGWRFRIKTVKGKRYISARKKGDEKGISPFSEEVWGEIQNLTDRDGGLKEVASIKEKPPDEGQENLSLHIRRINEYLRTSRGSYMALHCLFKDNENYCEYWQWSRDPPLYSYITKIWGENMFRVSGDEASGSKLWALKAFPYMCAGCPAFFDERMKKLAKQKETK
ncbi:hypothetical protein A3K78_08375 [Candidatus Bathyarchaeota archaeon RBG_13_52_12]|nr:MAG: hypothetical protein A3K78_08375 [Candidatus Bathyarchaeota archaeon RBG_13_52_12]